MEVTRLEILRLTMEKIESKYQHIEAVDWEKLKESDNRPKMSLQERAKIFLPFSALKGFEESLEKVVCIKIT